MYLRAGAEAADELGFEGGFELEAISIRGLCLARLMESILALKRRLFLSKDLYRPCSLIGYTSKSIEYRAARGKVDWSVVDGCHSATCVLRASQSSESDPASPYDIFYVPPSTPFSSS